MLSTMKIYLTYIHICYEFNTCDKYFFFSFVLYVLGPRGVNSN